MKEKERKKTRMTGMCTCFVVRRIYARGTPRVSRNAGLKCLAEFTFVHRTPTHAHRHVRAHARCTRSVRARARVATGN